MVLFKRYKKLFVILLVWLSYSGSMLASSGKIAGQVVDAESGDPLPGANITIEAIGAGASSDADGLYFVINLQPGLYTVKAQMVGYATVVLENVQVSQNQTTRTDFDLKVEAVAGEVVVVEAQRPIVQLDVASSQRIVTAEVIQERPLDNLEEILATEVGVNLTASTEGSGLLVRGGALNETDIMVDGLSTRNERNQQASTQIGLTAISEVEILTGGFNAEYGDIRSGLVNVVTKEGSLEKFTFDLDYRFSPAARKHFGPSPFDASGPFWQVYAGADAFGGISAEQVDNGAYPFSFVGWNEVARQFLADPDPSNDFTPQSLLDIWKWQHRSIEYGNKPDHIVDATISGPVPGTKISFMASQRYEDLQLVYPLSRSNSVGSTSLLKFTTKLTNSMKLSFNNAFLLTKGVSGSIFDDTNGIITGTREGTAYARDVHFWRYIWHDANFNPIETQQYRGGLSFNHVLSNKSFYDLRLEYTNFQTKQQPIDFRDTTGIKEIGGVWFDEQPFGYVGGPDGVSEQFDILGDFLISGGGRGQDHSRYWGFELSGDLVSQISNHHQIKTGFSADYTQFHERREINHGATTEPFDVNPSNWWYYDEAPIKLGAYLQDKIEFEGMIANVGLRLDHLQPGLTPINLDPQFIFTNRPYTLANFRSGDLSFSEFNSDQSAYKTYLSPRLAISHPMTATSKLFYNYGHFYQPPVTDQLYTVKPFSSSAQLPNVAADWPRTISYEIGFQQSLQNSLLIHVSGYYKDIDNQLSIQEIVPLDAVSEVTTFANNSYADIRGLEFRLERRPSKWWYGWVSMEYSVRSTGFTGTRTIFEDRQLADQERENAQQIRDTPVPAVNANLAFLTPQDFGPKMLGNNLLGDIRLNILQSWSDGGTALLNPDAPLAEQHRVGVIDYHNTDILLEKRFQVGSARRAGFYVQVKNLFNYKGFPNPFNYTRYVDSLKFPHEQGDQQGNDKLGDYEADHIDLGWNTWSQFVNPRDIFVGLRLQL